jgi:uncharacterized protein YgbK (DUF1537 family)
VRQAFCKHVVVLPEAAGILFSGGFPRGSESGQRRASQRAIYYVQRELEAEAALHDAALVLCDRGTVDGAAYWPGPDTLWDSVVSHSKTELARYDAVLHLRTPQNGNGYNHSNPLRIESAEEAALIDARISEVWAGHPRRIVIEASTDFVAKASVAIAAIRAELSACCQGQRETQE